MITLQQIRGARAMLGLKQHELAKKANVSMGTLNNIERGVQTDPKVSTMRSIQLALETEGIEFSEGDGGLRGIHLRSLRPSLTTKTILIIDDNPVDRDLYKLWLSNDPNHSYKIVEGSDAKEGYDMFLQRSPDCIILDLMMFGKNGFQLLIEMKRERPKIPPIIFVTAASNPSAKKDAMAMGANGFLDKKVLTKETLYEAVAKAMLQ